MDKKNEKTAQTNEMMELTLDQMDKVSGGALQVFSEDYYAYLFMDSDPPDGQDNQDDQGMVSGNPLPKWPAF